MSAIFKTIYNELGLRSLVSSPLDTKLLCLQRFVRLFAYGASTLILVLYLSALGISDTKIGAFMTMTLLGDVVISLILTVIADGIGRRRMLALGSLLMTASGVIFAVSGNYWILVAASVLGVISPSGNEIGPFKAIEESTISQLTPSNVRSDILAWYILSGSLGTAAGTVTCGWVVEKLKVQDGWTNIKAYRVIFLAYAVMGLIKLFLSLMLSKKSEPEKKTYEAPPQSNGETQPLLHEQNGNAPAPEDPPTKPSKTTTIKSSIKKILPELSSESRILVLKLCLLFAVDSVASGLVPSSWITYFFNRKFGLPEGQLGTLFFVTSIVSSASNLVASSFAKRIGLVKTMVFTHIPASIALALIPLPSNVIIAMILLVLRASTSSMDQAPRQAFLAAAVLPGERTAVMGTVNVVKTLSQSAGPVVTGWLAGLNKFWVAFVVAGCLKISYDVGMLAMFLGYRTQEERAEQRVEETQEEEREEGRGDEEERG